MGLDRRGGTLGTLPAGRSGGDFLQKSLGESQTQIGAHDDGHDTTAHDDGHDTTESEKVPKTGVLSLNFFDSVKEEINALAQEPEFIDVEMMTKT